tara:strand:+ start:201 stop:380 length:180 start_codon:yes stop_codon:yes gene_type:complete
MNKLSEQEIIKIIRQGKISDCNKYEKSQVMAFAFGEEYMRQTDEMKGTLQTYKGEENEL